METKGMTDYTTLVLPKENYKKFMTLYKENIGKRHPHTLTPVNTFEHWKWSVVNIEPGLLLEFNRGYDGYQDMEFWEFINSEEIKELLSGELRVVFTTHNDKIVGGIKPTIKTGVSTNPQVRSQEYSKKKKWRK